MRSAFGVLVLVVAAACGGTKTPPEEEVTATWTSGDDAPFEEAESTEE